MKLYGKRPVLTFQFDVSKLQKQLQSVIQIYLDQSDNFGRLEVQLTGRWNWGHLAAQLAVSWTQLAATFSTPSIW